jgi:hypothetical protein
MTEGSRRGGLLSAHEGDEYGEAPLFLQKRYTKVFKRDAGALVDSSGRTVTAGAVPPARS